MAQVKTSLMNFYNETKKKYMNNKNKTDTKDPESEEEEEDKDDDSQPIQRGRVKKSAGMSASFIAQSSKPDNDKMALPPRMFAPVLS